MCDLHVSPLPLISPPSPTPSTLAAASSNLLCSFRSRGKLKVIEALHEEKGMVKVSTSTAMGWIKIGGLTATRFDFTFFFLLRRPRWNTTRHAALSRSIFTTFKGGKKGKYSSKFSMLCSYCDYYLMTEFSVFSSVIIARKNSKQPKTRAKKLHHGNEKIKWKILFSLNSTTCHSLLERAQAIGIF